MKKVVAIIFVIISLLTMCSCGDKSPKDVVGNTKDDLITNSNNSYADFSDQKEKYIIDEKISKKIDDIEIEISLSSFMTYEGFKKKYNELFSVGIYGVPTLISKIEGSADFEIRQEFWLKSIYSILRIDSEYIPDEYAKLSDYNRFREFVVDSVEKIPEIIESEISVEDKISKLRCYGILSIPYIEEDDLNEYKQLFTAIGLHLDAIDWEWLRMTTWDSNWYKTDEYMSGADDFNYKKWMKGNKKELFQVHSYITEMAAS